jgi:hypothetical protein
LVSCIWLLICVCMEKVISRPRDSYLEGQGRNGIWHQFYSYQIITTVVPPPFLDKFYTCMSNAIIYIFSVGVVNRLWLLSIIATVPIIPNSP